MQLKAFDYIYNMLVVVATKWQQKSDSICFTDNSNNINTL